MLKLVFEAAEPDKYPKAKAYVILDPYTVSRFKEMPALTREHDAFGEFDRDLAALEQQIAKIRAEAKRKFQAAGIKV